MFDKKELIPSVEQNIGFAIRVLRRGQPPTYAELADGRGLGAQRARQSVPLESVIQAYRSTERTIILDLFSDSKQWPIKLTGHYADLVISTFDLLTQQMINSYREVSSALEAEHNRLESELVSTLEGGLPLMPADVDRWTRVLAVDPALPHLALAFVSAGVDQLEILRLRRRLSLALQPLVNGPLLYGDVGRGLTIVLMSPRGPASAVSDIVRATLTELAGAAGRIVAGVGALSPTLAEASDSCQQARDAARIGLARDGDAVVHYSDVLVDALLASQPALSRQLVTSRIGDLARHPYLLETLESLIANDLSQSRVARELFVHINTVSHRVKRIHALTGFDPLRLRDLVEMSIALRAKRLSDAATRFLTQASS